MPQVVRSALVHFSAQAMFDLVNDVARYPEFIAGCAETKITESTDEHMQASLLIAKAGIKQWFTTKNQLAAAKNINMQLVDGPFKQLSGDWIFTALADDACKIELNLSFEFSSKIVELAFGKVFNAIATNMVDAFVARAKEIHSD